MGLGPVQDTIVKSNQFDESVDGPIVSCALSIVIDESNVFSSDRDAALSGACVPAQ
jgi:hypothetical protein